MTAGTDSAISSFPGLVSASAGKHIPVHFSITARYQNQSMPDYQVNHKNSGGFLLQTLRGPKKQFYDRTKAQFFGFRIRFFASISRTNSVYFQHFS
jgi:hypothetical protein